MRNKWTKDLNEKKLVKGNKKLPLEWIKFPTDLLEEPRIEKLIANEGMKGLGFYVKIICRIYSRKSRCIGEEEFLKMSEKGISRKPMMRIYMDYGLFYKDECNHVFSSIDFTKFGEQEINNSPETFEKDFDKFSEKLSFPTPAPAYYKTEKENKKNDYHHSKKSDDGDDGGGDDGGDDAMSQKGEDKELPSVYRSEPMPRVLMDPIQYILSIPLQSAWAEAVLQTLGRTNPILRQLVMSQWEETKRFFALHAQAQGQAGTLLSEKDVKRYFTNCLNNATTAHKLQEHLAAKRIEEQKKQMDEMRKLMEQES